MEKRIRFRYYFPCAFVLYFLHVWNIKKQNMLICNWSHRYASCVKAFAAGCNWSRRWAGFRTSWCVRSSLNRLLQDRRSDSWRKGGRKPWHVVHYTSNAYTEIASRILPLFHVQVAGYCMHARAIACASVCCGGLLFVSLRSCTKKVFTFHARWNCVCVEIYTDSCVPSTEDNQPTSFYLLSTRNE